MGIPILTVGARVKYAFEQTAGVRPQQGFKTLFDITEAPEVDKSVETIDVSPINAKVTQYAEGRQDPGGDKTFTMNHTEDALTEWATLCALAETYEEEGKRLWWEYRFPTKGNSYFWAGKPKPLGNSGITGNSASQLSGHVVFKEDAGWQPHSTEITPSATTATVTAGSTTTISLTNVVGTVKITSSNPAAATASESSGTVTITGVRAGTSVLTFEDGNQDECKVVVTVTAAA